MATKASESVKAKSTRQGVRVLGRSAETGRYILAPATSKGASITIEQAIAAAKSVKAQKK